MKRIAILGSTGSIGKSTLELVDLHPDRFKVVALAAGSNDSALVKQCQKYNPSIAAMSDSASAERLSSMLPGITVHSGTEGLTEVSCMPEADIIISAISGAAGLVPTYKALVEGKQVALANKEALVMAGDLIMSLVNKGKGTLVPIDSEHSALQQCLTGFPMKEVRRLILTASGGPFLDYSREKLRNVTAEEALRHPTWDMGPKVTVDSATLMNKGLEVLEASHLFQVSGESIDVIIHPQSIIHSLVEFLDGTVLAQMGITDMKVPILSALTFPDRIESKLDRLDIEKLQEIDFRPPDTSRFPCLELAYRALEEGGTVPATLNAANESAVEAFLGGNIKFTDIPLVIKTVISQAGRVPADSLESILAADQEARKRATAIISGISR